MEEKRRKMIHYCWFGPKPLPELAEKCINSWKKFLPDYEIKKWSEKDINLEECPFIKEAYENKKWAFVADYARAKALKEYGGLYFDTDMEVTKDITALLEKQTFLGIEDSGKIAAGVWWEKEANAYLPTELLNFYQSQEHFDVQNPFAISIPNIITKLLNQFGYEEGKKEIQVLNKNIYIYPREYFYPLSYDHQDNVFTDNSCMIHYYDATWTSPQEKAKLFFRRKNMNFMLKVIDLGVSIKRRLKDVFKNPIFYVFLLIVILFFGIFCRIDYACDTYTLFSNNVWKPVATFAKAGRFVTSGFMFIVKYFNISIGAAYTFSFLFAIFTLSVALFKMYQISYRLTNKKYLSIIISLLILLNLFIFELFMFFEKGFMLCSVLLNVLAINSLVKYFENRKSHIISAFIYMFLANCCYQGTVGIFVVIAMVLILKYSKTLLQFIKNNIIVAGIYGFSAILNYGIIKIFLPNSRIGKDTHSLVEKVGKALKSLENILVDTFHVSLPYIFVIAVMGIVLLIIFYAFLQKKHIGKKILEIGKIGYLVAGTVLATIAPQIMIAYDAIWLVPRNTYALTALLGILLLYFCMEYSFKNIVSKIFIGLAVLYIGIQWTSFQNIFIDHYIVNFLDSKNASELLEEIKEYEEKTGVIVDKIAVYQDKSIQYTYPNIKIYGETNISAFCIDWGLEYLLQYQSGRVFKTAKQDREVREYFLEKNYLDYEKQYLFKEDTLHICQF